MIKWYSKPLVDRVVTLSLLVFAVPAGIFSLHLKSFENRLILQ